MRSVTLKHDPGMRVTSCINVEFLYDIHPNITPEDIAVLDKCIADAGMRVDHKKSIEKIQQSEVPSMWWSYVRYKKPTKFVDTDGIPFLVGYYKRGMKQEDLSDIVMDIHLSKSWHRPVGNPNGDWHQHYHIDMSLIGADWKYGYKRGIVCDYPAGMILHIHDYGDSLAEFAEDITNNLLTLKRYMDKGQPVIHK